jgi:nitrite reductase (NADH) small subunit
VAIANVGDKFYAINNTCLHRGGPLAQGGLQGVAVTCPWHGWQWDPKTGEAAHNPNAKMAVYAVRIENGDVLIEV